MEMTFPVSDQALTAVVPENVNFSLPFTAVRVSCELTVGTSLFLGPEPSQCGLLVPQPGAEMKSNQPDFLSSLSPNLCIENRRGKSCILNVFSLRSLLKE